MADELIVDLTNYKDRVGTRVDEGRYTVIVEDAESDKSKQGNPMVTLWYRIQDPGGEFDGATLIDRLTITDKALFRVVGFMQAVGLPTPKKKFRLRISTLIGKRLQVEVEDGEPYNGRVKSEIRGYLKVASKKKDVDEDDDDLDLDDLAESADEDEDEDLPANVDDGDEYEEDDVEEDVEEDDDDEEPEPEPEPRPKKTAAKKTAAKKAAPAKREEPAADVEEPEEIDLDDLDLG